MRSFDPPTRACGSTMAASEPAGHSAGPVNDRLSARIAFVLAALTAIRIVGLHASVVDLYMDEAQYWAWSRELAFGYFSKPPLLAWIIAATDPVCGSGEACVRRGIAAPAFRHRRWSSTRSPRTLRPSERPRGRRLAYGLAPGVIFSARIISTDVPLLLCWAVALAGVRQAAGQGRSWRWSHHAWRGARAWHARQIRDDLFSAVRRLCRLVRPRSRERC